MQWIEFQDTADRLTQGTTEGDWRSAESRSYYAVFHYFRELLSTHGLDIGRGGQSHFNLYSGLLNCGHSPVAAIASRIDRLREFRLWADYDLWRRIGQHQARSAVREAHAVIADFQAVVTSLSPLAVANGARQHLQAIGRLGRTP
jgi:uncharacterized protein (UPF0332 family)